VHGHAEGQLRQIDPALARDLDQMQRVGRCTDERGDAQLVHPDQPRGRVLTAAGDGECAERPRALEPRPEADEQPERERKEHAIGRADARRAQHEAPAARPPLPRLLRIEPAKRLVRGAGRLVHAHVALERIREVGAEGRMRGLIGDELQLSRER
jgi:hypothetical protein